MKLYFFIITVAVILTACENHDTIQKNLSVLEKDGSRYTTIKWIDSVQNIGLVEAGKKAQIKFHFKNTGEKPLYIISAQPGCGCTIADYPKQAIAPGAEGMITAAYEAGKGSAGEFRKNIHVTTNTKGSGSHYIFFYGSIRSQGDSMAQQKPDTARLPAIKLKELKRHFIFKPNKT